MFYKITVVRFQKSSMTLKDEMPNRKKPAQHVLIPALGDFSTQCYYILPIVQVVWSKMIVMKEQIIVKPIFKTEISTTINLLS